MATAATSLLGLALPVTGELSGTWGDTVNVSITALLDTAVAGTTTLSSDADVTLTTTTLAANQARQAIILWTAGGTVTRTITAPAQSKSYIVINKTSSSQSIKIVGVGPTTGVTIVAGTAAFVVWNGVDFVTASVTSTTGILPVANGGTGLSSGTSGGVLAYTATGTLASSAALAANALVIGGGAGAAPSTTTTGTGVVTALGVNVGTAGAFVVNGGALGTPSSGTVTNLTGTASININGTVGATTPTTGAFTTVTTSGAISETIASGNAQAVLILSDLNSRQVVLRSPDPLGTQAQVGTTTSHNLELLRNNVAIATVSSTGLAVTGLLSSAQNSAGLAAQFVNADTVNGYGVNIQAGGTSATRYALVVREPAGTQDWFKVSSVTGEVGNSTFAPGAPGSPVVATISSTGLAVTGTLSATGAVTLSGGTANGVAYLDGSKVLTTGSALTFNGTSLGVGSSSYGDAGTITASIGVPGTTTGGLQLWSTAAAEHYIQWGDGTTGADTYRGAISYAHAGDFMRFWTSSTERMRLDSSGNLGLGVTPSASAAPTIEVGNAGNCITSRGAVDFRILSGAFQDGASSWKYAQSGQPVGMLQMVNGAFGFANAPSGTAGNAASFTTAMTLDASGNLGIGTTSPTDTNNFGRALDIRSSTGAAAYFRDSDDATKYSVAGFFGADSNAYYGAWGTGTGVLFYSASTERMRLDSSGNLLVGTTTAGAGIGFDTRLAVDAGGGEPSVFKTSGGANAYCSRVWNSATSGDNKFIQFITETGGTDRGSITYNRAGGLVAYNTTSDYRAKDINGPVTDSGALIDSVPVYMGKMKDATQERPMFIAHEVPAYAHTGEKDAVDKDGKPVYQQMDAAALIPVMWAELQSLRARVAQLESKP
jgi:hypothetical protein